MGNIAWHSQMRVGSAFDNMLLQMNFSINQAEVKRILAGKANIVKQATDDRKLEMNRVLRRAIQPYEPFNKGTLTRSAEISKYGIYYNAVNETTFFPYPTLMYLNPGKFYTFDKSHHRGATDHWDVVAWSKPGVRRRVISECEQIMLKKVRGK